MAKESLVDTRWFLQKAAENDWTAFDDRVTEVSNDQSWLDWTNVGITSKMLDERDLAICLLEKTRLPFSQNHELGLRRVMQTDENQHLRRKSAIALFVHGIIDGEVLCLLQDAKQNDDELKGQVSLLLSIKP